MDFLVSIGFLIVMLAIGGGIGRMRETRHQRELDQRSTALSHIVLVDTRTPPPGMTPVHSEMVMGNAVIGTDYLKQMLSTIRSLFGGELHSYQTVMTRARREAQTRMVEAAALEGARAVINIRFETSQVATSRMPAAEVLCYGTMVR